MTIRNIHHLHTRAASEQRAGLPGWERRRVSASRRRDLGGASGPEHTIVLRHLRGSIPG
jgi:hypothetical protein